jgi:hypothetical protein
MLPAKQVQIGADVSPLVGLPTALAYATGFIGAGGAAGYFLGGRKQMSGVIGMGLGFLAWLPFKAALGQAAMANPIFGAAPPARP